MIKNLPIGISTFPELIQKQYVYIDKTDIIYSLISKKKYYFLCRPRRFGKSLLVSTLEAIFRGKKELFTNLAINGLPYDWQEHPVISISFAGIAYTNPEALESGIKRYINDISLSYDIVIHQGTPGEMLQSLVMHLAKRNSVVLLVTEIIYPHDLLKTFASLYNELNI
jgi:hypothetical protein